MKLHPRLIKSNYDRETDRHVREREITLGRSEAREGLNGDVMLLFVREVGGWSRGAWPESPVSHAAEEETVYQRELRTGVHRGSLPRQRQSGVNVGRVPRGVALQREPGR